MKPEQIRVGGVPELHEWLGVLSAEGAPRSLLLTDERVMEECFPLIVEALPHTELMVVPEGRRPKAPRWHNNFGWLCWNRALRGTMCW